jgi:hypothetical protein
MGDHIGLAQVKVVLLDRSPFSGQQKQEVGHWFSEDTFGGMTERNNVTSVPNPLHGIRVSEVFDSYPNFLVDTKGTPLEDAETGYEEPKKAPEETGFVEPGTTPLPAAKAVPADPAAKARKALAVKEEGEKPNPNDPLAAARRVREPLSKLAKEFFTWQIGQNLFKISDKNPAPSDFGQPSSGNSPEWTYVLKARLGGQQTDLILTPYMKKCPPDAVSPVHWGAMMGRGQNGFGGLAMNQPFQIVYYHDLRDPAIAKDAKPLQPRIRFVNQGGREIDMMLTNTVYLAIHFGIGSDDQYMVIFRNDLEPYFFKMQTVDNTQYGVLVEKLEGFNCSRMFDPNHKYFTVQFEPACGGIVIRNSVSEIPWVINPPLTNPIFIGEGFVKLYGGNVQAGFAIRPIQYYSKGSFKTPETTFNFVTKSGKGISPKCTTAIKGTTVVEQIRSYDESGEPEVHLVDAEWVNGEKLTTVIQYGAQRATEGQGLSREVDFELNEVEIQDRASIQDLEIITRTYNNLITLKSGDMRQPNGYVVKRGRSPYIFMLRCEVPAIEGKIPVEETDVTCDVMGIELNWNATSYNEIKHTGSIRFLNYRPGMANHSKTDYRSRINRSTYLRIYAGWQNGAGEKIVEPIFTGQTLSAEVSTRAEREIVTFQIEDYMAALQGSKFVLSPWYDGMKASLAVRDIVLMTGFPDIFILTDETRIAMADLSNDYGLSFANPFEEPIFKMKDGSSFLEGILSIGKLDFKTVYFDGSGRFHYDMMPGGLFNNANYKVKHKFWSKWAAAQAGGAGAGEPANQAFNLTSINRLINDVYNVIQVFSVEKRILARLSGGSAYKAGIYDPTAEGYLGYRKHLMIAEPALGNYDAMMRYLDEYRRRVFIPPLTARFEVYGRASMKPLDIIHLNNQPLRIMNIQTHIDKSENTFYQNIEGEWFFSAGAGKDQQPQLLDGNANVGPGGQGGEGGQESTGYRSTF